MAGGGSKPGERRGGRQKGTPNKLTATIKEAIEQSFETVGGAKYLAKMAVEQPAAYMTLLGKVLPTQVNANVNTDAIAITFIREADDDGAMKIAVEA